MTGMSRIVILQDTNVPQKYQELLRKVEGIGGRKIGRHVIHCRLFNRKTILVLLKERSSGGSSHDNGLEGIADECTLLECGLEGANILQQMEIYAFKSDGQFEGTKFVVGDFIVSVCTFMSRNNLPRGLLLEVQYTPCYGVVAVENLFDEFIFNLIPNEKTRKPIENMNGMMDKVGLIGEYSLKHTALQYVGAFNILRKFEK